MRRLTPLLVVLLLALAAVPVLKIIGQRDDDVQCGIEEVRRDWKSNAKLESCAASGLLRAQTYLGMLYLSASRSDNSIKFGLTHERSTSELRSEGLKLLNLAASRGDAVAQNELGVLLLDGDFGVTKNYKHAAEWLKLADRNGDEIAPYNLARMHYQGMGVDKDQLSASGYLWRSALCGYVPSLVALAHINGLKNNETLKAAILFVTGKPNTLSVHEDFT